MLFNSFGIHFKRYKIIRAPDEMGYGDNMLSFFLNENIRCDISLEPSDEGSQRMIKWKNKDNYP